MERSEPAGSLNTRGPGESRSFVCTASFAPKLLTLDDLAGLDTAGAYCHASGAARRRGRLHRLQIRVPAPPGYVVRVRDVVAKLRAFAAILTYLCHHFTPNHQNLNCTWQNTKGAWRAPQILKPSRSEDAGEWAAPLQLSSLPGGLARAASGSPSDRYLAKRTAEKLVGTSGFEPLTSTVSR